MSTEPSPWDIEADEVYLDDYWRMLYRRRWMIALVVLASGVFTWQLSALITPRYEASAQVYVPSHVAGPVPGPEAGLLRVPAIKDLSEMYAGVLKSAAVRQSVAERVGGTTAGELQRDIDVVVSSDAGIRVYARHPERERAIEIVGAVIDAFRDYHAVANRNELERMRAGLAARLAALEADKQDLLDDRWAYVRRHAIASVATALVELETQRTGIENELRGAVLDLETARARGAALRASLDSVEEDLRRGRVPASLADSFFARNRTALEDAEVTVRVAESRLAALRTLKVEIDGRVQELPGHIQRVQRYDEDIANLSDAIRRASAERNAVEARSMQTLDPLQVLDPPDAARRPIYPILALNLPISLLGGLVVGVLYALLLDYLERRRQAGRERTLRREAWAARIVQGLLDEGRAR